MSPSVTNPGTPTITTLGTGAGTAVNIANPLTATAGLIISATPGAAVGSGVVTLGGATTVTGVLTIASGTLAVGEVTVSGTRFQGSLAADTIMVNSGGTLLLNGSNTNNANPPTSTPYNNSKISDGAAITLAGGTIKTDGTVSISETVGTLTLTTTNTSSIDFGELGSGNTLRFATSNANSWSTVLNVYNWTKDVDHLFFGSSIGGLGVTVEEVSTKINLYYGADNTTSAGTAIILSTGEIYVVPEPSTAFAAFGLLSLVALRERRWFLRCREARAKLA